MTDTDYETILVERDERVGIITLNRPKALNALNTQVMNEVTSAAADFDDDPGIGAIIITGSAKAFAASNSDFIGVSRLWAPWSEVSRQARAASDLARARASTVRSRKRTVST